MAEPVVGVVGEVPTVDGEGGREWAHGLCRCCVNDCGVCSQTLWCHPCTVSNVLGRVHKDVPYFDLAICLLYGGIFLPITAGLAAPTVAHGLRRVLIQRYNIVDESSCASCCKASCCCLCSFCQVQHELAARDKHCGGYCAAQAPAAAPVMGEAVEMGAVAPTEVAAEGVVVRRDDASPTGLWRTSIFDGSEGECCESCCCYCCIVGHIGAKLDRVSRVPGPLQPVIEEQTPMSCASFCGAFFCPIQFSYAIRRELIERYRLRNEPWYESLILVAMCPCCTVQQQRREMTFSGEWPGSSCGVAPATWPVHSGA